MTISDKKLEIIELVTKTEDLTVLDTVKELLDDDFSHDHWENLSKEQLASNNLWIVLKQEISEQLKKL